ncbi:MAG: hypothetical protein ACYDD7_00900 [Acidimicrobiales bacterium]
MAALPFLDDRAARAADGAHTSVAISAAMSTPSEPVLVTVGDIIVTEHWVLTPSGPFPLAGTYWMVTNQTITTEHTPGYAIVLAVMFFLFCLLGLLFLLIKERRMQGFVTVTLNGPGCYHATQVPVVSPVQVSDIEQRVHYIRSLVAALPA